MHRITQTSAKIFFLSLFKNMQDSLKNLLLPVIDMNHTIYAMDCSRKGASLELPVINSALWDKNYLETILQSIEFNDIETLKESLINLLQV